MYKRPVWYPSRYPNIFKIIDFIACYFSGGQSHYFQNVPNPTGGDLWLCWNVSTFVLTSTCIKPPTTPNFLRRWGRLPKSLNSSWLASEGCQIELPTRTPPSPGIWPFSGMASKLEPEALTQYLWLVSFLWKMIQSTHWVLRSDCITAGVEVTKPNWGSETAKSKVAISRMTDDSHGLPVAKPLVAKPNLDFSRLFWTFRKKLKPKKTQNSRKILKKLKQNSEKTQKPATPVELSCC